MGFAKFRAGFVGDACNDWSVTPNDGFLKQNEETYFAVSFAPRNPGTSAGFFVIETEVSQLTFITLSGFFAFILFFITLV